MTVGGNGAIAVDCTFPGGAIRSLSVPSTASETPAPYQIRSSVADSLQLDGHLVQIESFTGPTPTRIACTVRDQKSLIFKVFVSEFNKPPVEIAIHPSETVFDLKFSLSKISGLPPFSHVLAPIRGAFLQDSAPVVNNSHLQLWYEVPSIASGQGKAHRSVPSLIDQCGNDCFTLQQTLNKACKDFANLRMLGSRSWNQTGTDRIGSYSWLSYQTVYERCRNFAAGLNSIGVNAGDKVGIMSVNRAEWAITDFTCAIFGFISVTLYPTLGPDVVEYIINHSEIKAVVVSNEMLSEVAQVRTKCPKLSSVIMMDDNPVDSRFQGSGYTHKFSQVERIGEQNAKFTATVVRPDDIASICYTSGTTGAPKGAILTHRNLNSACAGLNNFLTNFLIKIRPGVDTYISYLPLAHIYERLGQFSAMTKGVGVGYYSGDIATLLDDVSILRPSLFPGVPRVFQRIYDKINSQIEDSGLITKKLFQTAYDSKLSSLRAGSSNPDSGFLDYLVFKKISAKFGGNLTLMTSGSAPISQQIATFMRICMRAAFVEGYGLTETCALTTLMPLTDTDFGQVGIPASCCEVMLVDVPSMSYLTTDKPCPRGEIWIRGPSVFKGYFKEPAKTREALNGDGWFQTGDIGQWRTDGRLQVIDRLKNIFKLAQGEYVRPEYIEGVYKMSPLIANIFVYGDSLQPYLVAIIVPDRDQISKVAAQRNADFSSKPELLYNCLDQDLKKFAAQEGLRGFEQVRRFAIVDDDFTVENGLLTPTLKLKRHEAKQHFQTVIDKLYREDPPVMKSKL